MDSLGVYGVHALFGFAAAGIAWLRLWRWWVPIGMVVRNREDRKRLLLIVARGALIRFPLQFCASLGVLVLVFIPWVLMVAVVGWLR